MHILYLHQYFVAPDTAGGTRSYEMARRWVAQGHRVTMVTSAARIEGGVDGATRRCMIDGIEVVVLPVAYDGGMSHARRVAAFVDFAARASVWALRVRADVIFASSTPLTISIPALLGAARHRIPMVFEVRDAWPDLPIAVGALRNPLARMGARALEWAACRGATQVVALSPGMAEAVERCGVDRSKIHVIPNACDIETFAVEEAQGRRYVEEHFPGSGPLVVYAGSFGALNDAAWLVDVAAATPGVRFAFVGEGPGRADIEARARAHRLLDERVFVRDPIPKREIPWLLRGADLATSLFLPIPAMAHNSANKFFDALASGTPVAINYGGWQAQLLRESGAGLVLPRHDVSFAGRAIGRALREPSWGELAGKAAGTLARERFARATLAEDALAVVTSAVQP